jgi:hypothetical protein
VRHGGPPHPGLIRPGLRLVLGRGLCRGLLRVTALGGLQDPLDQRDLGNRRDHLLERFHQREMIKPPGLGVDR